MNIVKLMPFLILIILNGCAKVDTPYEELTSSQIRRLDSLTLCKNFNNWNYKKNTLVVKTLLNRGYEDCSSGEIFCMYKLKLKPGTSAYANCRLQEQRNSIAAASIAQRQQQAWQENWSRQFQKPQEIYVHHSYWPYY